MINTMKYPIWVWRNCYLFSTGCKKTRVFKIHLWHLCKRQRRFLLFDFWKSNISNSLRQKSFAFLFSYQSQKYNLYYWISENGWYSNYRWTLTQMHFNQKKCILNIKYLLKYALWYSLIRRKIYWKI